MGSRIHETLQRCYDDLKYTKLNSLSDLLAYFDKLWQKNWHDAVTITRPRLTGEHYRALGERLIETYYQRYAPFDSDVTIGTEMRFNFCLDEDGRDTGFKAKWTDCHERTTVLIRFTSISPQPILQ